MQYTQIKSNGEKQLISSSKPLSLEKLQELVGGYIEFATRRIGDTVCTFCINEEGLLMKLPQNKLFPEFVGDVVLGQMKHTSNGDEFVGGIHI